MYIYIICNIIIRFVNTHIPLNHSIAKHVACKQDGDSAECLACFKNVKNSRSNHQISDLGYCRTREVSKRVYSVLSWVRCLCNRV